MSVDMLLSWLSWMETLRFAMLGVSEFELTFTRFVSGRTLVSTLATLGRSIILSVLPGGGCAAPGPVGSSVDWGRPK